MRLFSSSSAMADTVQSQEVMSKNFRKQLAVAVRSIQWSYAIFWSQSTTQQGVLEWVDGYYNGDIKTRKSLQATEIKHDKIGLQRSEQLRELYRSLLEGDIDQQTKRPSDALSPEDLSDAEWYYLVCMSFVFNPGQGLPGRAFANRETIWLCNAQYADSKVFSRSLLAKSASIQTVVCFPHLEGVIELGVTELVAEDPNLVQHIKASLLDFSKPVCSEKSTATPSSADDDKDPACARVDYDRTEDLRENNVHEELSMDSPDGTSHVQSWHFMNDDISNGYQNSMNSSDCISKAFVNEDKVLSSCMDKNVSQLLLKELEEGNNNHQLSSLDFGSNAALRYRRTLSLVLKSSTQLTGNSVFHNSNYKSSFGNWKKVVFCSQRPQVQQKMLKKILFSVPLMHGGHSLRLQKSNGVKDCLVKLESKETCDRLSDKQREHEKYLAFKSMIPSVGELDKASILDDMIRYLIELEARIEELESCVDSVDYNAKQRRQYLDMIEQTSDNYENKIGNGNKLWANKRKASDIYYTHLEEDSEHGLPLEVKVSMKEEEVVVEMECAYREYILLDIMDEFNNLQLDVHSVQSSTNNGIFTLTMKSKFRGAAVASTGMIKQVLRKIGK